MSGLDPTADDAHVRARFYADTGLPFKPTHYTLWRNYGRVFKLLLLAQTVGGRIQATQLARTIHAAAPRQLDSDTYLTAIFASTRFPSPAFDDYAPHTAPVHPFLAVLRLLCIHPSAKRGLAAEDVSALLIANDCRGLEPASVLAGLTAGRVGSKESVRQIREMLRFAGQHSALAWLQSRLVINSRRGVITLVERLEKAVIPAMAATSLDEIDGLSRRAAGLAASPSVGAPPLAEDPTPSTAVSFIEGARRLVQHTRIERNRMLRRHVLRAALDSAGGDAIGCDCCGLVPRHRYPWSSPSILEVHHLLPLASPARPDPNGTRFDGVVLVCPSCHKAVHARYRVYLKERAINDFASESEARSLYDGIRSQVRAITSDR